MRAPRRAIDVLKCSIVDAGTTCIVNASNSSAALGSGVSGAIRDECGGAEFQREITEQLDNDLDGVLEEGDCLVTSSGTSTRFKVVLHVQAVDYRGIRGAPVTSLEKIQMATVAALREASGLAETGQDGVSVAFPLLGAGAGGLGAAASVRAMVGGLKEFFGDEPDAPIARIVFAVPEDDKHALCERLVRSLFY